MNLSQLTIIFAKCSWRYEFDYPAFFELWYNNKQIGDFLADHELNIPPYSFSFAGNAKQIFLYEHEEIIILAMSRYFNIKLKIFKFPLELF